MTGSGRLSCIGLPRQNSRKFPSIWAGYLNEWKFLEDMSDEFDQASKGKKSRKWKQTNANARHGVLSLSCDGSKMSTHNAVTYGYFETCIRASDSDLHSAFSLEASHDSNVKFTILSYCASEKLRKRIQMNAVHLNEHYKNGNNHSLSPRSPNKKKYIEDVMQKHIFAMPETPVIVGLDWTPDHLTTYIDGHVIRQVDNKFWHQPMHVTFSLQSHPGQDSDTVRDGGINAGGGGGEWKTGGGGGGGGGGKRPPSWSRNKTKKLKANDGKEAFEVFYIRAWSRFPNSRKLNAPGLSASPTHHLKTNASSTHRSLYYQRSRSRDEA